jgi:hypothetical protein
VHRASAMRKFKINNLADVVPYAVRNKIADP